MNSAPFARPHFSTHLVCGNISN